MATIYLREAFICLGPSDCVEETQQSIASDRNVPAGVGALPLNIIRIHLPFSPTVALSHLEDSGLGADTYFDAEQCACPQLAAFLSRHNT